jgi:transketolase
MWWWHMRDAFVRATTDLLDDNPRTALVLADISAADFRPAATAHPDRVLNVGIREQLLVGVAGGLALTGLRPIAHTYAPFLVERAYEQVKLDLDHQGVGAILVSVGASYDAARSGRTHYGPEDVALIDTLPGWTVHVPGHADEVPPLLRMAAGHDESVYIRLSTGTNRSPVADATRLVPIRPGEEALVVVVGPLLDPVLEAVAGLDVAVAYTNTPRPFDVAAVRAYGHDAVILVEPYLAGTSAWVLEDALPHVRKKYLGVRRTDPRRYGSPRDHAAFHGLDAVGLGRSIRRFLAAS